MTSVRVPSWASTYARNESAEVEFEACVRPRFDYARESHKTHVEGASAVFESPSLTLNLTSSMPLEHDGDDDSRPTDLVENPVLEASHQ